MANSLEFSVEEFLIIVLKADSRLSGKSILHFDEEEKAETKGIVIRAVQGNHNLAGPGGYDGEAMIEFRSPGSTSRAENDKTAAAINQAIYERSVVNWLVLEKARTASGLEFIVLKDEAAGDRSNSQDLRKRVITIPWQAKLVE